MMQLARELPASFAQRRIWTAHELSGADPSYTVAFAVRMAGPLDATALERAIRTLVRRHEALRTTFALRGGRLVQRIAADAEVVQPAVDLRHLEPEVAAAEIARLRHADACRPFDLARGPLLRTTLVHERADLATLLLSFHHIVLDRWSRHLLLDELGRLYAGYRAGHEVVLPPVGGYAEVAERQDAAWMDGRADEHVRYWAARLAGAPAVLAPIRSAGPRSGRAAAAAVDFEIAAGTVAPVRRLARRSRATLFMVLLAALDALLYRVTGEPDVVVGVPVAGRHRSGSDSVVGFFVNTLVMRTEVPGDLGFDALLGRVRATVLDAYRHADLPFDLLVERLADAPRAALERRVPWCDVVFAFAGTPERTPELPGVVATVSETPAAAAKFDLTVALTDERERLAGCAEYDTGSFRDEQVRELIAGFGAVLAGATREPSRPILDLDLALASPPDAPAVAAADAADRFSFDDPDPRPRCAPLR